MQCLGVDVMFGFFCNDRVWMRCLGVDALFGCRCIVLVFMQCSGVDAKHSKSITSHIDKVEQLRFNLIITLVTHQIQQLYKN